MKPLPMNMKKNIGARLNTSYIRNLSQANHLQFSSSAWTGLSRYTTIGPESGLSFSDLNWGEQCRVINMRSISGLILLKYLGRASDFPEVPRYYRWSLIGVRRMALRLAVFVKIGPTKIRLLNDLIESTELQFSVPICSQL